MTVETEIQGGRGSECRDPEHRVFEQPKREDAADSIALAGAGPAQRPVVDREAARSAGCGEHTEPRPDRLDRVSEFQLRATVDPGCIPDREDISEIRHEFPKQADRQPAPGVAGIDAMKHMRPT